MAKHNFNYAKVKEDGELEYPQIPLLINGENVWTNVAERYVELGYYPIEHTDMPQKEGFYYTVYWAVENEKCVEKWEEHEVPTPEPEPEPTVNTEELLDIVTGEIEVTENADTN